MPAPAYDIVLYGATGFTGRLVATYLMENAPQSVRLAIAGRSDAKLRALAADLQRRFPERSLGRILADSGDRESLDALVAQTRVVATTVGPYLRYGANLVDAVVDAGKDYCDLTGEVPFMRQTIDRCHGRAQETGARIVHTCGYDSIPSDLGTLLVQEEMAARGAPATRIRMFVGPSKGGASGGTIASMFEIAASLREDKAARKQMADPYSLNPAQAPRGPKDWDPRSVDFVPELGQWASPFFMGPVNTRVVRRTHALLGTPWGTDFSYQEYIAHGPGWKGRLRATGLLVGLGAVLGMAASARLAPLLAKVLPKPGEGPDEQARETGFFRHAFLAEGPSGRLLGRVIGNKDPGYAGTAIMMGEAALCLALDREQTPDLAGVLTPATALGMPLVERLRAAGMTLSVEAWEGTPRI